MKSKPSLYQAFTTFLQQQTLEGEKLLLMGSGGVDSVVLLHVAAQVVKPENLAVFHLNHNVRKDSGEDEQFVQNLCTSLKIKFYAETLPLLASPNGGGIEAEWRVHRKNLSQQAAQDFGAKRIFTAHHATDLVETMIFRLTKGAGPSGLAPFDTSTKPFWQLPKQALVDYATEHQLEWREDPSNADEKHERNLIRHQVLPALRQITPNLEVVFVRETQTFEQVQKFVGDQLHHLCHPELDSGSIEGSKFLNLPPILQTELLRTIATKTPSQSELTDCLKWLQNQPEGNSEKMIGGTKLRMEKNRLTWQDPSASQQEFS